MEASASALTIKLNDHALIGDKNLLTAFRFGVNAWTISSKARLEKLYQKDMNYSALKIKYLRGSKDSVFFDSVQREEIAASAQLQSRSNSKRRHSVFEDNYNSLTDCISCKRHRLLFKGHTNKNCPAKISYLKEKLGENYT